MAQTILVFDFGTNEEAAQQARHKIEGWKQGFRLGNKILLKFERPEEAGTQAPEESGESEKGEKKKADKKKSPARKANGEKDNPQAGSQVRVLVSLGFSDHEKLSLQRWLDRIPSEEPFKSAKAEVVRQADPNFDKTVELFESLD